MGNEKVKVAKFYLNDPECKGCCLILDNLNLEDSESLDGAFSIGDVLTVKIEEMDKSEFENLTEFYSWY